LQYNFFDKNLCSYFKTILKSRSRYLRSEIFPKKSNHDKHLQGQDQYKNITRKTYSWKETSDLIISQYEYIRIYRIFYKFKLFRHLHCTFEAFTSIFYKRCQSLWVIIMSWSTANANVLWILPLTSGRGTSLFRLHKRFKYMKKSDSIKVQKDSLYYHIQIVTS